MNYSQSQLILDKVNGAGSILLNCHRSPDPDSIGSALSMMHVLKEMGKQVTIVCPSEELAESVNYLKGFGEIKKDVDFSTFDLSQFDLFITLDSSSWSQVTTFNEINFDKEKLIVVDHHLTNAGYGSINLIDSQLASTGELLYSLFEDWEIKLTKDIADCLMAGIVGDTGAFRYPGAGIRTFEITISLMKLGADKDLAIHNLYRSEPFELIKFYGEVLSRVEIDDQRKFVWSAIPFEVYEKIGKPAMAKESAASLFAQVVEETNFGFIALEAEKNSLSISFRSRSGFDTSKISVKLGGGGHKYASGAKIINTPFETAVETLLKTVRSVVDEETTNN